eukprot:4160287-Pyramimonas_sp.AAC.1
MQGLAPPRRATLRVAEMTNPQRASKEEAEPIWGIRKKQWQRGSTKEERVRYRWRCEEGQRPQRFLTRIEHGNRLCAPSALEGEAASRT